MKRFLKAVIDWLLGRHAPAQPREGKLPRTTGSPSIVVEFVEELPVHFRAGAL